MGRLLAGLDQRRDYPVVQGVVLLLSGGLHRHQPPEPTWCMRMWTRDPVLVGFALLIPVDSVEQAQLGGAAAP